MSSTNTAAGAPSGRLLRAALLSSRLFVDSLEKNYVLRYGGLGLMQPSQALDVLIRDGQRPGGDGGTLPFPTRARLGLALSKAVEDQVTAVGRAGGHFGSEDLTHLRACAKQLSATVTAQFKGSQYERAIADFISAEPGEKRPLPHARNWTTTILPTAGSKTRIVSDVEVRAELRVVSLLCDPRRWSEGSLFWLVTNAYDFSSAPPPSLPPIGTPHERRDALASSWRGRLHEVVAGLAIFSVHLDIEFDVTSESCSVEYKLVPSRRGAIMCDDGSLHIAPVYDEPGWLKARVIKDIDFRNAPYGGLSSGDLLAPSFFASWMRVQQDVWISRITAFAEADRKSGLR